MKCETVRDRLLDYLDDELEAAVEERIRDHLGGCLECRREMMAFRSLEEQASGLRVSEEPAVDLWPDIERRIGRGAAAGRRALHQSFGLRMLATAAMLILVVGGALWLRRPAGEERVSVQPFEAAERIDLVARADQARVESGVIQLRKDLLGELDRRRDELAPETWSAIETSLRELDQAIGEIHLAMDANPEDRRLNHLLATRYRQELDFLRRITRA